TLQCGARQFPGSVRLVGSHTTGRVGSSPVCRGVSILAGERALNGEGRERLAALLELPAKTTKASARALHAAGDLAWQQGDYIEAMRLHEKQLALDREIGNIAGVLSALTALGANAHARGNLESARTIFEECLRLSQEAGNDQTTAQVLNNLARL